MAKAHAGWGLRGKLLTLLLAFSVPPLAVVVAVGYTVSRSIITDQAERALREVTAQQALHLATELSRERLLLRTIAGHLPRAGVLSRTEPERLADLLVQGLPEGGVFDGLRIVAPDGRVLASVALRNTAPHWPASAPAVDWAERRVAVHREGPDVLALLVAVPATAPPVGAWLEGHVRATDFAAVFALPDHLMGGVELAVVDGAGSLITAGHPHAAEDLSAASRSGGPAEATALRRGSLGGAPALVAVAPVEGTDWSVIAALPIALALAPLARLRDTTIAGAVGLVALILVTGMLTSRTVTRTLRELGTAARRFGRGAMYELPRPRTRDEVAHLVEAFSRMAQDLEHSRGEIERLHETEMERAQQLATVGELASGVAHEIRNPLTGVRGAIDLALRGLAAEEATRVLLEEAQRQLARMENATTQLLRYARPPELREVVVDANELAERALHVVTPEADRRGVRLRMEPSADAAPVRVDPELMVQVLVNLLLNAVDVTADGGTVTLWIARHAPEMWLGVRDTGPGVPQHQREQVFRPFFTTKGQGTGLGLSISRQIVTRHGGSLRIEDTPGGGATFVVALPMDQRAP